MTLLDFGMTKFLIQNDTAGFCWKKTNCGSAGSGGGAVAERSEAMERKRNHEHSDSAKCKHLPPELIFFGN